MESCTSCRARSDEILADNRLISRLVAAIEADVPIPAAAAAPLAPAAAEPAALPAIDGYRIAREIHRGGQGVVFEAVQLSTQRRVALKVLLEGTLATRQQLARFEREIETVLKLRHPNLVTVYDRGTTRDGRAFFAMELVEGVPLDVHARTWGEAVRERGVDASRTRAVLELFGKVCAAVSYAHQRGVIHRDLKPSNVLVDAAGEPRVLDFGLAKAVDRESAPATATVTRPGWFLGTLAYASPEQLGGDPDQIDVRSDVWSLGVILFELLTGELPYAAGASMPDLVRAILESEPRFPRALDDELRAILERALAKEREHRYQSAAELLREIERWLRGEPIDAKRGRLGYLLRKTLRRYRVRATVAALVLVVIVTAGAVAALSWRRAAADARRARLDSASRARVTGFVEEMLASLNPDRAKGRTVTVREVVDDAARRLDGGMEEEPEVEAELRTVLGRTYRSLGLLDEAEAQFERVLELLRGLERSDPRKVGICTDDLSQVAFLRDDLDLAVKRSGEAIGLLQGATGADFELAQAENNLALHRFARGEWELAQPLYERSIGRLRALRRESDVAASLGNLGQLLAERGRYVAAEARLRESLEVRRRLGDAELVDVAWTLDHLGDLLDVTGRADQAQESFRAALELQRKLLGRDDPRSIWTLAQLAVSVSGSRGATAAAELRREAKELRPALEGCESLVAVNSLNAIGMLARDAGDFDEAEREMRAALALCEKLVGREHASTAVIDGNLGWVLLLRGRYDEADRRIRASLASIRRLLGDETIPTAQGALNRAWCCQLRFDLGHAEQLAREALETFTKLVGPDEPRALRSRDAVAWILHERGENQEAERLARENLERKRRRLGESHVAVAATLGMLGEIVESLRRPEEAEQLYEQAIALRRARPGEELLALATDLHRLGRLRLVQRRMEEALEPLEEALELRRELLGDGHLHLVYSLNCAGTWHLWNGELDEAGGLFDEAAEMARGVLPPDHPDLGLALANLAIVKAKRGETAQTEQLLLEALKILRCARGDRHPETTQVAGRLADPYRSTGRFAEAALLAAPAASTAPPEADH